MQHHLLQDQVHLPDTKAKRSPNQITPQSETVVSERSSDPEQARGYKDMPKNLVLPCKVFQNAQQTYQPTTFELFKQPRNKTEETQPKAVRSATTGIQSLTARDSGHYAKGKQEAKVLEDYTYHQGKDDDVTKQAEQEMHEDYEYVKSLEKGGEQLVSRKRLDFSNIYDLLLEEFKECECLAQKLSKQTESVNKEVHNKLLKSFAKLENHSISLELALQQCKKQMKNNSVCKENGSNVFRKERKQYHEIQELKAQMQDKNIAISELKKLIEKCKRTSNVNAVCAECGKCVFNSNHDACVSRYLNDVNARTKKPNVVPISASKPKRKMNKSVATPHKKTVASDTTIQKSKSYYKEFIVQLILFIIDSGCTKHMTGNLKLLCNFVEKFLGTVHFGNDQFAPILGYGDLNQGNVTIKRVYYVEGLNHNLFSVGQFCDADLEIHLDSFLRSKDETPEVLKDFLTMIQRNLQAQVISVRTDRGTEFLNKTLHVYFKEEGIEHQTSTPRTPEQNGVVERWNHTLVEAARTMLSASKLPLSFWAEAVATACYTQNRSIIISVTPPNWVAAE
ncbi:gag-pol polyprotein [Tanacetum coccineum]|uniref:Gag-pol polyprotein n=1 Tax=Tanacetum coccineum TaxID=301880 RepID=A0ABQ5AC73_9ASTR